MITGPAILRRLPSLNALKAFEAAARHESFTRAAAELCVTQGAVSHQVKALESELGFDLFKRERRRLRLTRAGHDYLNVVRDAFDRIALGTADLTRRQSAGTLTVSTSPDFAAKWLVHRLGRFSAAHPGIDIRMSASLHHVDFAREDVDMAVRHGTGDASWKGLDGVKLAPERLFAVCSPHILGGRGRLAPKDLIGRPLLHLDDHTGWKRWFAEAGVETNGPLQGLVLDRASMAIDAAIGGQGFALARTTLASWDLLGGRLAAPFEVSLPLASAYWIVAPRATASLPKIAAFREWLLAEVAADRASIGDGGPAAKRPKRA